MEQITVEVGELTFDVRVQGPAGGAAVILLHGFPQTSYEWRSQQAALAAAGYRTIAPDQRGYSPGARPVGDENYRIDLLAGDVIGLADALEIDRFHLVGHDWGAGVAWMVAAMSPDRLLSLTAVSVPHPAAYATARMDPDGEQSRKGAYVEAFVADGAAERMTANDAAFLGLAFGDAVAASDVAVYREVLGDPAAMDAALAWYRANDLRGAAGTLLPAVEVPTLYVWSDQDCCLGRDAAELSRAYVTGPYRFEVLEGVSHWVPEEAADDLSALLVDFLADPAAES